MITPTIDPSVFVADGAKIIGNVSIKKNCGIWYNAVIRSENNPVIIGENTNIQDNAVLHLDYGFDLSIGSNVTVGHGAIVHGCTVGNNCIIGMGSIIMNGAVIGNGCIVGAGAVVTEGTIIPDNSVVIGTPGRVVKACDEKALALIQMNAAHYVEIAAKYKEELDQK